MAYCLFELLGMAAQPSLAVGLSGDGAAVPVVTATAYLAATLPGDLRPGAALHGADGEPGASREGEAMISSQLSRRGRVAGGDGFPGRCPGLANVAPLGREGNDG